MTFEVFAILLFVVSLLTSLTVEAIKKGAGEKYNASSNLVASIVAIILGTIVGVFYCILAQVAFNAQIVVLLIVLIFASWLCSMLGYDKVIQTLIQIKSKFKK